MRLLAFADALLKNRTGGVPRPSYVTYLVTYRCNARCGMCDSWRMKPGDELSAAEAIGIFEKVGRLDVVRLSGGEPFLRDDLAVIADGVLAVSNPLVVHVTTNGSFPEKVEAFAAGFKAPRRLAIMVSFDGDRSEHDESRGAEVTFDKAVDTVRRLVRVRDRLGVAVSVNHTVISPRSLSDSGALHEIFDPLHVDVQTVLAYAESSMYAIKLRGKRAEHLIVPTGYPLHPKLAGADVTGFVKEEIARVPALENRPLRVAKRYYLRGLLERLEGKPDPKPKPRCVALRSHLRLLPDGRVPVCQFNTEVVGDLRDQAFEAVWNSAATREARGWVDRCPGCWAECEVLPSAVYTGDILRGAIP